MAGDTSRLVRFANLARMAGSLRSPRGGWVASFLCPHCSQGHGTPCHYGPPPPSSLLTSHHGQPQGLPLHPHSSPLLLRPHSSLLTHALTPPTPSPHPSPLTPHSSPLTPHPSPLTPHSSLLTPHSSLLTPHSSPLTPHSSPLKPRSSWLGAPHVPSAASVLAHVRAAFGVQSGARGARAGLVPLALDRGHS